MIYDKVTQKPRLLEMDSPLYMNYRCNAYQVRHCLADKAGQTLLEVCLQTFYLEVMVFNACVILALIWSIYFVCAGADQAAASNFWEV